MSILCYGACTQITPTEVQTSGFKWNSRKCEVCSYVWVIVKFSVVTAKLRLFMQERSEEKKKTKIQALKSRRLDQLRSIQLPMQSKSWSMLSLFGGMTLSWVPFWCVFAGGLVTAEILAVFVLARPSACCVVNFSPGRKLPSQQI